MIASNGRLETPDRERKRGFFRGLVLGLGLAAALVLAPPVHAQPDSTASESDDSEPPIPVLQILKPSYATNYDVDRQTTNWQQKFDFGSRFGFFSFNNKTKFDVRTDSGRDEERRDGKNSTTMRFLLIPKTPITVNLDLGRLSVVRPGDRRQTDESRISIGANYNLRLAGMRHTLNGGGAFDRRVDSSSRQAANSKSTDSGWNGNLTWRTVWSPVEPVAINTSLTTRHTNKDSRLEDDTGVQKRPTIDESRNLTVNIDYSPTDWMKADLAIVDNTRNNAFFIVRAGGGAPEVMNNDSQSISAHLELRPLNDLTMNWSLSTSDHRLDYQERRDLASAGDGDRWEGRVTARALGVNVEGTLSSARDNLAPATSANTETETNLFEGKLERKLSPKVTLQLSWLFRATKLFFDDPDPTRELDRDELKTKIQPILIYKPGAKWTVNASYIRSTNRRIERNPSRASQTKDEEDFAVDIGITYALSRLTKINQNYSIKAIYSQFDFASTADRLLATQRITTSVSSSLTPRVSVGLEHRFTLQDSGPFRLESGERLFARSLRKYRQELSADLQYRITPWISLTTDSRFLRTDDVQAATEVRTTRRNLELREGVNINRSLGSGLRLAARGSYVRSSIRESYWQITSSLSKDF